MATGTLLVFHEAKAYMVDGDWASTDDIKCAILDNTTTPAEIDTTPALSDYTEVGTAGSYVAGGISIGALSVVVTNILGGMWFDSTTNPSWAKHASNDTDAYWGLVYNDTAPGDPAIAYIDLGGPVDMSAGTLTLTWHASGLFTVI